LNRAEGSAKTQAMNKTRKEFIPGSSGATAKRNKMSADPK
jgi:hypothetical protein